MLHNGDCVCDGTLKKYNPEVQLAKEKRPQRACQDYAKPPKEWTGVEPGTHDHLTSEHWYTLTTRQNLQFGPKFQSVAKYAVDRSWCELKCGPPKSFWNCFLRACPTD